MIPPKRNPAAVQASYNSIDYRLRPGKHAERQMIVEAAARLRFGDLKDYRYVGMGSIYFTDFKLIYRSLGISSMISIEEQEEDRDRFEWNKPYVQIKMLYGSTELNLPNIEWDKKALVWLDYDGQINASKLIDLDLVLHRALSGSMILISINAEKPAPSGMLKEHREADPISALRLMIGGERTPTDLKPENLRGAQAVKVYYRVINDAIHASVARFNALVDKPERKRVWKQIVNFQYKDGAAMLTIGGVIYDADQGPAFDAGNFKSLEFYRPDYKSYSIKVPRLTMKEMSFLEQSTSMNPEECNDLPWLDSNERATFLRLYRYLPNFVSAEV